MEYAHYQYDGLRKLCERAYAGYGFNHADSAVIADVLLTADLFGIESHGIQRLFRYHNEIQSGMVAVANEPVMIQETPISAVWDANKSMGQVSAHMAMDLAVKKAEESGIGMVAVRNANHYGIAGYYALMAERRDLLGICMTNTEAIGVPTHSKKAMFGTNPIAFAFPAEPVPFLFDAATTVVTRGKLEVYSKRGDKLPGEWALDETGAVSDDSARVLANIIGKSGGGILPVGGASELLGGHKGYGLGVIVDIMTAVLSQGATSNHVSVTKGQADICHFFMAINYGLFGEKADIKRRLSAYLGELRSASKADGCERVFTHGEKEFESRAQKLRSGIPINEKTLAEIAEIGRFLGFDHSCYMVKA